MVHKTISACNAYISGALVSCILSYCHTPFTLCHLLVQFPLELDPWELLQKHVLSDYVNNEVQVYNII